MPYQHISTSLSRSPTSTSHASKVTRMDGWLPSVDLERSCSACHSHPNGHLRQHFVASKKVSSGSSGKRHLLISAWIQGRKKNASCFVAISISCRHCIVYIYINMITYIKCIYIYNTLIYIVHCL